MCPAVMLVKGEKWRQRKSRKGETDEDPDSPTCIQFTCNYFL
jgi:hypothetical protein